MSNQITVTRTVFTDYADGVKSYGYRLYDSYASDYGNLLSEDDMKLGDQEFLELVVEHLGEVGNGIFDWALETGRITVDNHNYKIKMADEGWILQK